MIFDDSRRRANPPADVTKAAAQRDAEHLDAVRAVHRRSAYERVLGKIAEYQAMGTWTLDAGTRASLDHLIEERDRLRHEMAGHGQVDAPN